MKRLLIKKGEKYGRLTIIKESEGVKNKWRVVRFFLCKCDCGKKVVVRLSDLRSNKTQSCKCLLRERISESNCSHGHSVGGNLSKTYQSWIGMRTRVNNKKQSHWHRYGGRGIVYCKRWDKFENFLFDMGERPKNKTLDRIDNDKGYYPHNCRWATNKQQANNKSKKNG